MVLYRIKDVVHTGKTPYQMVDILDTETFGRCLVLDGKTQSTEVDEHIYHECLVHPSFLAHPEPRSVFIGGGGEGATLREVLHHKSVQRVIMADLDKDVVELCRLYLPQHHQGGFDDPRVELLHVDARGYLASSEDTYDVMVLDLVDPIEGGPSYLLYTQEFYNLALSKLNPGGVLVTQAGPAGLLNYTECFTAIHRTLSETFPEVYAYNVYIPAFTTLWGFIMAFKDLPQDTQIGKYGRLDSNTVDDLISRRLSCDLCYYDGDAHRSMFSLPKYLKQGMEAQQQVITDDNPVFMI